MEQLKTEQTLLDSCISRCLVVGMDGYSSLLNEIAEHTTANILDDIQRNAIIDALVSNKAITAGKVLIKKSLTKLEQDIKGKTRQGIEGGHGTYQVRDDGVYRLTDNSDIKICSRLEVLAMTRTVDSGEWGRLLNWNDLDGRVHKWAMPASLTAGDSVNVSSVLLDSGLAIRHGSEKNVIDYIMAAPTDKRMFSTSKPGWAAQSFITPDQTYGDDDYIFQSNTAITARIAQAGALQQWRDTVAVKAIGNSRLMFGLCSAFAGSLLEASGVESGGFHLHGSSGDGKSTIQKAASSVWGKPDDYKCSWKTTSNGLEATATAHNDGLLVLDEIKEMEGRTSQVGQAAYMLANGQGKTRMTKTLGTREPMKWRLIILSSGELTLSEKIADEGGKTFAGQEVRLCDVPSNAGAGMGAFEVLHGADSPRAFADGLTRAASQCYGVAGTAWLTALTNDQVWRDGLDEWLDSLVSKLSHGAGQQVGRVARRFALLAYAGELATREGITGWNKGDATKAVKRCFRDWLADFGTGNRDHARILEQVQRFLESQGSRFERIDMGFASRHTVRDRVGFLVGDEMDTNTQPETWVLASQITELASDYPAKQIKEALHGAGYIESTAAPNKTFNGIKSRAFKITMYDSVGQPPDDDPLDNLFN